MNHQNQTSTHARNTSHAFTRGILIGTLSLTIFCAVKASAQDLQNDKTKGRRAEKAWSSQKSKLSKASSARIRQLNRKLGSWRTNERMDAYRDLLLVGSKAQTQLRKNLNSPNGYLVRWSTFLLGHSGDSTAYKPVETLFFDQRTTTADKFYALGTLTSLAKPENLEFFQTRVRTAPTVRSRLAAAVGCERLIGASRLADFLLTLSKADKAQRDVAIEQLRWLKHRCTGSKSQDTEDQLISWAQTFKSEDHKPCLNGPELNRIFGDGYQVLTDFDDEDALRKILIQTIKFRRQLSQWCEPGRRREWTSFVRLYKNRGDFMRHGATREYNFYAFTEYYYSNIEQEIVGFYDTDQARMARRLQHEFSHDVLDRNFGVLPPWLSEGICESFEAATVNETAVWSKLPMQSYWKFLLQQAHANNRLPKLSEIIKLSPSDFYGNNSSLNYAIAWSFCRYLIEQKKALGVSVIRQLLKDHRDAPEAKKLRAFRGDFAIEVLEPDWKKYIQNMTE